MTKMIRQYELNEFERMQLAKIIESTNEDELLEQLKEFAENIDIFKRRSFENTLLDLAKSQTDFTKRNPLYELFPSLGVIWHENEPEKNLEKKFREFLQEGKEQEAASTASRLIKQGLDYIGVFKDFKGRLYPLPGETSPRLISYYGNLANILDEELHVRNSFEFPIGLTIIDVFFNHLTDNWEDVDGVIWLLLKDLHDDRYIYSINLKKRKIKSHPILSPEKYREYTQLGLFQNHLLLISKNDIQVYHPNDVWQKWFSHQMEITALETDGHRLWVGLSDGSGYILKHHERVGVRDKLNKQPSAIKKIRASHRFVAITSSNHVTVTDIENTTVLSPIQSQCTSIASIIKDDELIITINGNGTIIGRNIARGDILWKINLKDSFDSLFTIGGRVYCQQGHGKVVLFKIPLFSAINKELSVRNVHLTESPTTEWNPRAPVRFLAKFIGRRDILEKIQTNKDVHFLITGPPKIGKTSLLMVLEEVLSGSSRCCYLSLKKTFENANNSFQDFENKFIDTTLSQHVFNITEPKQEKTTIHQRLKALSTRIRGDKQYCVFCLDDFPPTLPADFTKSDRNSFQEFLRELYVMPGVRLIMTCSEKNKAAIWSFLKEVMLPLSKERSINQLTLPLFLETEVKAALRGILQYSTEKTQQIFDYIGCYPHLIGFYVGNQENEQEVKAYFESEAKSSFDWICGCFKELSNDALILMATLVHEKLNGKSIKLNRFYQDFPLLKFLLPPKELNDALKELNGYMGGISTESTSIELEDASSYKDTGRFKLTFNGAAPLIHEATQNTPWIKVLFALYLFYTNPNQQNAEKILNSHNNVIRISFCKDEITEKLRLPFRDDFVIKWLIPDAKKALGMPMDTFVVIPLKPWRGEETLSRLRALYFSLQNFLLGLNNSTFEWQISTKFYLLYFDILSEDSSNIKKETKGLERVSIIAPMDIMEIVMAPKPMEKEAQVIFTQLKISERSPYIYAGAVHNLFVGRDVEMALIRGLPENIGIFGTRTIGKTSLLLKLYKDLKDQKQWNVIAMDCSRISSERKFLKGLANRLNIDVSEISTMGKFRKYITDRATSQKTQYLFLLDEVDELVEYDTKNNKERLFKTFNQLCTEPLQGGGVAARFVLSGFEQVYEHMKNPESRLYNFMVFLPLKPLSWESAYDLVTTPMKEIHITWEDEKNDASFLVDQCSRHPHLLQAACNVLLKVLDDKEENNGKIERKDINDVFVSRDFTELCMRLYHSSLSPTEEEEKKSFSWAMGKEKGAFLKDIHKLTILIAVLNSYKSGQNTFTLPFLQDLLAKYGLHVSPDLIRIILNRLCLYGTFRLKGGGTILASLEKNSITQSIEHFPKIQKGVGTNQERPSLHAPGDDSTVFHYEFGVKIFPSLLVHFLGGEDKCQEEIETSLKKEAVRHWIKSKG